MLVAVGCLALTSCESPTGPTSVVTADTFATSPPPFPDTAGSAGSADPDDPDDPDDPAVFDVSPDSKSVTGVNGTTTFTVNSTVGWSIESVLPKPPTPVADWLTATKIDESTISVSYEANSGTSSRTVNIKAVGSGGLEKNRYGRTSSRHSRRILCQPRQPKRDRRIRHDNFHCELACRMEGLGRST